MIGHLHKSVKLRAWAAMVLGLCLLVGQDFAAAAERPNILLILMEDMGVQIPAYGDHTAATPQLDRLAAEGVVVERAHVTAATCASSRGSLFTGLYPHQNGILAFIHHHGFHFRDGMPTYVQTLKQAGYRCGLTYKTGISPESSVPFDFRPSYKQNRLTGKDGPALVNNSIDNFRFFLSQLQANTPFYFQAQTPDTHSGWDRPEFIQPGSEGWPYPDVDPSRIQGFPSFGDDFVLDQPFARVLASYYGAIQRVDWYVGNLLALLEEYGHSRNTLVVFTADHGPSHILRGKTTPYENGLRVPFIARWPGTIPPGTRSEALVSFVDLAPTFMEVAGLRPPGYLPGYSLVPVFRGQPSERDCLYSAYNGHTTGEGSYWPTRTITDGRFKLIHNLNGDGTTRRIAQGYYNTHHAMARILDRLPPDSTARRVAERSMAPPEFELYDLELDPGEIQNLAGQPDDHEIERDLRDRLWNWRTEVVRDPFCDPAYLAGFNDEMAKQVERMEAKREEIGGSNVKGSGWKLDWDHRIPAWDPTPYTRRDCP